MINTVKIQENGWLVNGSMSVSNDKGNRHYQEVQDWIANGGIVEPEFTDAEVATQQAQAITNAISQHLDKQAQVLRYDNMMSARSYAGYVNPFQAEATKLADWASDCWVKAGQIEADVQAGTIPMPTVDEAIAMLPVYGA